MEREVAAHESEAKTRWRPWPASLQVKVLWQDSGQGRQKKQRPGIYIEGGGGAAYISYNSYT